MPRTQPKNLDEKERKKLLDELWTTIALLETRQEVKNFFKDLLSETEAVMLARRLQIAKLLLQGWTYENISTKLKTSYVTIGSVQRWLQGGFGGYANLLPRLKKEIERQEKLYKKRQKSKTPCTFEWIKRKYPLHFLLFNLVDWAEFRPPKKLRKK